MKERGSAAPVLVPVIFVPLDSGQKFTWSIVSTTN